MDNPTIAATGWLQSLYIDLPHQKVLMHSGMTIHTLHNLAIMRNRTPDLQMAKLA